MTILYPLPGAEAGVDEDPRNPFHRALAPMMNEDKLLPRFLPLFIADHPDATPQRWLGCFTQSPGGRILFFPGLETPTESVQGSENGTTVFARKFLLDHLSLDKNREAWHLTTPKSGEHQGGPSPRDIGDGRIFWFTMSVQDVGLLRPTRSCISAVFSIKDQAHEFKLKQLQQLATNQGAGKLPLPPAPTNGEYFPFFAVIVGPTSFTPYEGPDWWPPYGSKNVTGAPTADELDGPTMSILQLPFDDETDIQLMACWLPGRLLVPMIQTAPKPPSNDDPPVTEEHDG